MRVCAGCVAVLAFAAGCGDASTDLSGESGASADASIADFDGDGLCTPFEQSIGTDPFAADTDEDGLPDPIEAGYGSDPADGSSPAGERLAFLEARRGAAVDVTVRVTVEGSGEDYTGVFAAEPSLYDDGVTADAFFGGAHAVSAEPGENTRAVSDETFVSVLGRTRLEVVLRFEHAGGEPLDCARAYPFRYDLKSSRGETLSDALRLLVVAPAGVASPAPWCPVEECD